MTLTAVLLITVSAFVHAGWNLIGKRNQPSPAFFLLANTLGCLCLSPVFLMHTQVASLIPTKVWILLAATGFFQAVYYTGLAEAYRRGDMSIAYPLTRSAPVILVACINLLIGSGKELGLLSIAGMVLVAAGGCILPMQDLKNWKLKNYMQLSCLLALVAATGTTGYSIIDDRALHVLRDVPGLGVSKVVITLIYALFEGLSSSAWQALFVVTNRGSRSEFKKVVKYYAGSATLAGIGIYAAYGLVLIAMAYAKNVSYIVAFRQLGIPLGATLGIVALGEPKYPAKFVGMAIMLAGLVLVAVG